MYVSESIHFLSSKIKFSENLIRVVPGCVGDPDLVDESLPHAGDSSAIGIGGHTKKAKEEREREWKRGRRAQCRE